MSWSILLLAAVTLERLGELWLARRNTRALLSQGADEVAAGHYPLIVLLHAAWLAGMWLFGWSTPLRREWVVAFAMLQGL